MKLPLYVRYNENIDAVEDKWRKSVRNDKLISECHQCLSVMLYEHLGGAVGIMYEIQYRSHAAEHKAALDALGFKLVRTVQMLTCHAKILRRVI